MARRIQRRILGDKIGAADVNGFSSGFQLHRLGGSQNEILGLRSRQWPQVWTRAELDRRERYVRFHGAGLVECTTNRGLTLEEPIERQLFSQMGAGRQVVQSSERHTWDVNMRLTWIISFHAPLAVALELDAAQVDPRGECQQRQASAGGQLQVAVRPAVKHSVAQIELSVQRGQIDG